MVVERTRPRLMVVGGFLGAGKTTALIRLAKSFHDDGKRVGLITNDQAAGLVDTGTIRVQGFPVEEVAGACFCCKFDDLASAAEKLRNGAERPDVLLGEPVGSCTDLAATVVAPFRKLHGDLFSVAPYSVLVDPARAREMVVARGDGGFSEKVAYIFRKQLEEADVICISKADTLARAERGALLAALAREFQLARVVATSSVTGEGFARWRELLAEERPAGGNIVELDYDLYAEGEAELGWLNLTTRLAAATSFDGDAFVQELVQEIADDLAVRRREIAHLKVLLSVAGAAAVANAVASRRDAEVSRRIGAPVAVGELVVNARVHADPSELRATVEARLASIVARFGLTRGATTAAHFRPGRPVPTHRVTAAGG
jgi:Ni2+-binding GTPase involved in maturation of urease and hydrogenase